MNHSFGTLLARKMHFGSSGNGTPYISDGDSARVLFFANLSGAYDGNAGAAQAAADFERIAHCANTHDAMIESLCAMIEWLDDGNRMLSDACRADVTKARALVAKGIWGPQ